MKQINTIGLDLAKQIFQVHGADADGSPVFNRRLRRSEVLHFFSKQPACLVGIEACGSAHYWAREMPRGMPHAFSAAQGRLGLVSRMYFKRLSDSIIDVLDDALMSADFPIDAPTAPCCAQDYRPRWQQATQETRRVRSSSAVLKKTIPQASLTCLISRHRHTITNRQNFANHRRCNSLGLTITNSRSTTKRLTP